MNIHSSHIPFMMLLLIAVGAQAHVRDDFHKALGSEERIMQFLEQAGNKDDVVQRAYNALATTILADYAFWPAEKWNYFTEGRDQLEACIAKDSKNPELRYIRLLIQMNVPGIVDYTSDIGNDLRVFETNIAAYDAPMQWKKTFISRLIECKNITKAQKTQLIKLKENLS